MKDALIIRVVLLATILSCRPYVLPPDDGQISKLYFNSIDGWKKKIMIEEDEHILVISGYYRINKIDFTRVIEFNFKMPDNKILKIDTSNFALSGSCTPESLEQIDSSNTYKYIIRCPHSDYHRMNPDDVPKNIYGELKSLKTTIKITGIFSSDYIIEADLSPEFYRSFEKEYSINPE